MLTTRRTSGVALGCALLAAILFRAPFSAGETESGPAPVLVELFTSEGCSSCPPADVLLGKLDQLQAVQGARVVVMSEHVDYWDHDGWKDPFSSHQLTERQESFVRRFHEPTPYTPEMIVDGQTAFVGSDGSKAESAIRSASRLPAIGVSVAPAPAGGSVAVEVAALNEALGPAHSADVFVAFARDQASTDVQAGENRGRTLYYVSVVSSLRKVGKVNRTSGYRGEFPAAGHAGERLIAFAQEAGNGRVVGCAMYKFP